MAFYVEKGKIDAEELVDRVKLDMIGEAIEKVGGKMLAPIKTFLGDAYTYGEIKYAMAEKLRAANSEQKAASKKLEA